MGEIYWNQQTGFPLLGFMQVLPLAGGWLLLWLRNRAWAVHLARLTAVVELGLAVALYLNFDAHNPAAQFAEYGDLLGPLSYHVAADGLSVLFVLLVTVLIALLVLAGALRGEADAGLRLMWLLGIEGALVSMFLSVNLLWFILASVVEIGLLGQLLGAWGAGPEPRSVQRKFYQFQYAGLLLCFAGLLMVAWSYGYSTHGAMSFDLMDLKQVPVVRSFRNLAFLLLCLGVAVRVPLFPVHGWLPVVMRQGDIAAPLLLLGANVGLYVLLRFVLVLLPTTALAWRQAVAAVAVVGVFYGLVFVLQQRNLRGLLTFAALSHAALIVLGVFSLDAASLAGTALMTAYAGLAFAVMLLMLGRIYWRARSTDLRAIGLAERVPVLGVVFMAGGVALIGLPGTPGFDAMHGLLEGAILPLGSLTTIAAAAGNAVAMGFLLWAFRRAFFAAPAALAEAEPARPEVEAMAPMEYLLASIACAILLAAGYYMAPWAELVATPMQALSLRFGY